MPRAHCCSAPYALVAWRLGDHIDGNTNTHSGSRPGGWHFRTKTMNTNSFDHIQDPIVRAEALRAKAMADGIIAGVDGLRKLVAAVQARIAAYVEYRRTVDVRTAMTHRAPDDIRISRGDIPAVASALGPRQQAAERTPGRTEDRRAGAEGVR